jgi:NADH-quinone oxidoreductase subunit N
MREATVKYFLLSIFSSALLLYGMSWLYGAAGTTNLAGIADAAAAGKITLNSGLARVSAALLLAGLGFRITIVPFHFYAPDVFQGVLSSAAAMLSVVPKLVGFVALFRLLPLADGVETLHDWSPSGPLRLWLALLAVLTMFVGNLMALRQTHLHRMLAYSSMAHTGYMLGGLTVGSQGSMGGATALLFYLVTYGLITIGVFALLSAVGKGPRSAQTDADVSGLSRTRPAAALGLAVCLISLTGLPPTAGFLGKLNLIIAAWSEGTWVGYGLAIAQGINAPITAWYYLRLVAVMYLQPAEHEGEPGQEPAASLAGACCTAATLALFVVPQWLWDAASRAAG